MKIRKVLLLGLLSCLLVNCLMVSGVAADCEVISIDEQTGVTIYRDSGGGIVFSGLPTVYVASAAEQQLQLDVIKNNGAETYESPSNKERSNYVDYEYNPIYIGTWGGIDAYARHTLGEYNSNLKYLTSYGYVTYYNTSGNNALPYRNGNATESGQAVVDVAKYSYFDIRDLGTDVALTLKITDWGPDQQQHGDADGRERIADLDKTNFETLHGNTSDGVFYARTWVPITNYNP